MDESLKPLFVIAAGGTGAKVCEAIAHLAAAGLAPSAVNILLVDGDSGNGNRIRAVETVAAYGKLQAWPWAVQPAGPGTQIQFFGSTIAVHSLAEPFSRVNEVGLLAQILDDDDLVRTMRVLLDEDELTDDLSVGFTGRPNLGSVVMERHLRTKFRTHMESREFMDKLVNSCRPPNSAPRVMVVGSVFGGTGASLLPVIKRCVEAYFVPEDKKQEATGRGLFAKLKWAKLMQLPYFSPQKSDKLRRANPHRHSMDTASALWYYGLIASADNTEPIYLVASEAPQDRTVFGADGGGDQLNPAFYHEILAALAVLDFYQEPEVKDGRPIRHFGNSQNKELCAIERLPVPAGHTQAEVLDRLAALLHLAAAALRFVELDHEYSAGLLQYAKKAQLTGWDKSVQELLNGDRAQLTSGPGVDAVRYFARLLMWAKTSLGSAQFHSSGLEFKGDQNYVSLHNTMCEIKEDQIFLREGDHPFPVDRDNLVARICRLALAGLHWEGRNPGMSGTHSRNYPYLRLVHDSKRIVLGMAPDSLGQMLHSHEINSQEVKNLCEAYGLPNWAP